MAIVISSKPTYFLSYIKQRIRNNKNFLCAITGSTGSGKSWSTLSLAEKLDPNFDIDNVCFTAIQFMNLVNGNTKELKKGSNLVFDELQVQMGHLDYQKLQSKLLNYVLQTFRHKNFVLWITSPQFSFINASARKLFHCRMETKAINMKTKKVRIKPLLIEINQDTGKAYNKYLRVWKKGEGVRPLKVLWADKPSKKLIKDYEDKKNKFTSELNQSILRDLNKLEKKEGSPLTERQEYFAELVKEGLGVEDICSKMNIVKTSFYQYIETLKRKGVLIKPKREGNRGVSYDIEGFP